TAGDRNDPALVSWPGGDSFQRWRVRGVLARKKLCLRGVPITVVRTAGAILQFSGAARYRRQHRYKEDERGTDSQPGEHPTSLRSKIQTLAHVKRSQPSVQFQTTTCRGRQRDRARWRS